MLCGYYRMLFSRRLFSQWMQLWHFKLVWKIAHGHFTFAGARESCWVIRTMYKSVFHTMAPFLFSSKNMKATWLSWLLITLAGWLSVDAGDTFHALFHVVLPHAANELSGNSKKHIKSPLDVGKSISLWGKDLVRGQGHFLVRRDESPENYCHSPGVVVVGGVVVVVVVVVRRQKL